MLETVDLLRFQPDDRTGACGPSSSLVADVSEESAFPMWTYSASSDPEEIFKDPMLLVELSLRF